MRTATVLSFLIANCGGGSSGSSSGPYTPPGGSTGSSGSGTTTSAPYCGDGICDLSEGEDCTSCADCDTRAIVCGNGECQAGEDESSCYEDCGPNDWYQEWIDIEDETLALVNERRAQGGTCPGGETFPPSGPLTLDVDLREAGRLHSWDMGYYDYVAHPSCNGRTPYNRAQAQGAPWRGENIAHGYSSPQSAVNAWMNSDGHCRLLLKTDVTRGAIGYAKPNGDNPNWTLNVY